MSRAQGFPAAEKELIFIKGVGHCGLPREDLASEESGTGKQETWAPEQCCCSDNPIALSLGPLYP